MIKTFYQQKIRNSKVTAQKRHKNARLHNDCERTIDGQLELVSPLSVIKMMLLSVFQTKPSHFLQQKRNKKATQMYDKNFYMAISKLFQP